MIRFILALLLGASSLFAQLRLTNESGVPFKGWINTTTDNDIGKTGTFPNGDIFVRGARSGKDTWSVDVWTHLSSHEHIKHNWDTATDGARIPQWRAIGGLVQWFGGSTVKANNTPLTLISIKVDGAAIRSQFTGRVGPMVVDVWLRWYPSQPGWLDGESYITFSDPTIPEKQYTCPEIKLSFGNGDLVWPLGNVQDNVLIPANTRFADGQARAAMFYMVFPDRVTGADEWATFGALSERRVAGVGISKLWADGNVNYTGNAHDWTEQNRHNFDDLNSWDPGFIGAAPDSGVTGAQEDQVFVRGEPMSDPVAAPLVLAAALKMANRPSNFREFNGDFVLPENHPQLIFWSGRPHWHTGVSPDQLGKTGDLGPVPGGWFGPDRQHLLYNTVGAAARYTNSQAAQQILKHIALAFLLGETTTPGWSTSGPDVPRSVGWAGIFVVWIDKELEDRQLAAKVVQRWRERVTLVYIPRLTEFVEANDGWWDVRLDSRLGLPEGIRGAMAWQSSIGAWGLDYACRHVGPTSGVALALQQALQCVERDWVNLNGSWVNLVNQPYLLSERNAWLADPNWKQGVTWFSTTWAIPALDLVLRYHPKHAKALSVLAQWKSETSTWNPPK